MEDLSKIDGLRVVPSQANYVMVELTGGKTSREVTRELLVKHRMLIKDLSGKIIMDGRQFLRLAVRNQEDNDRLVEALKEIL